MDTLHRHLAAVWFADIVGYTRMSEVNEGKAVRLARVFQRAALEVAGGFGGRVVKSLGDGALAEFPSTEMAVRSAHAVIEAFGRMAAEEGLETNGLRIGVHVGDVAATDDGDLYGDGVNVASRIQSLAEPGEVWVSEDVWRQLRRRPELAFESRGEHELKGIGHPMQAHAVRVLDEETWTPPVPEAASAGPARRPLLRRPIVAGAAVAALFVALLVAGLVMRNRSGLLPADAIAESAAPGVAVLPFTVNDPELARWKEGMIDLLSTNLDGAGGVRAIDSRTVLARWRERVPEDGTADLPTALDVARRAGGRYGLVGSAVSSGASMRLAVELYDLESGAALGSPQVEGSPDSIFGLVDRLSIEVLALLLEQGADAPRVDLASVTTSSLPALKSFLAAEALARRGDFQQAIPAYEQAIESDSTFALAHYRLGEAFGWTSGLQAVNVRDQFAAAERHVAKLPARESDLLEVSLAYSNGQERATRLAEDVAKRYPDDPGAWFLLGETYFHLPYQSLASREKQREPFAHAVRLDPNYLPAEIHLVDLAFMTADEAAADSLMARFGPQTAGSAYGRGYGVAYALAFGDSVARTRELAGLDTLSLDVLRRIPPLLIHPRFFAQQRAAVREARSRREYEQTAFVGDFYYGQALLQWGELDTLAAAVERGTMFPPAEEVAMTTAWLSEMPLPAELYDEYFQIAAEDPPGPRLVAVAARALESGDRAAAHATIDRLRASGGPGGGPERHADDPGCRPRPRGARCDAAGPNGGGSRRPRGSVSRIRLSAGGHLAGRDPRREGRGRAGDPVPGAVRPQPDRRALAGLALREGRPARGRARRLRLGRPRLGARRSRPSGPRRAGPAGDRETRGSQARLIQGAAPPLAFALLSAGRPDEGVQYVEAIRPMAWLGGVAARLYEQVGDRDQAIEALTWVGDGWAEADPELQPRVLEAVGEIERLRRLEPEEPQREVSMTPKSPNPETEAMERAKDSKQPPREENQGPKPPPGMGSEEKKRGKGTGQAPLPRDGL